MSSGTAIEWTDATWNPVSGCTKVSPGCAHCYAERVFPRAYRRSNGRVVGAGGELRLRRFTDVATHTDRLEAPLSWRKPRRVFVNSMSDLFHEAVPDDFVDQIFVVMALASQHTFQVLTKRPERMLRYCSRLTAEHLQAAAARWFDEIPTAGLHAGGPRRSVAALLNGVAVPLPNVWLGASAEDQERADKRWRSLRSVPAAVRFWSFEPLIGPIANAPLDGIGWAIVGGESGVGARPCEVGWIRNLIAQCRLAGVPCFVKQLGAQPRSFAKAPCAKWPDSELEYSAKLRDSKGGDMAEWPEDLRVRQFPEPRR